MKKVDVYTDGACSGNPGSGGYCAILVYNGIEKEIAGGETLTTNNRMELTAVISALEALKEKCIVNIHSDSKYVVDAFLKGWIVSWEKNGWRKSDKSEVLNVDLWQKLLKLTREHTVEFFWIKGHDGHEYNERCDRVATEKAALYRKD